MRDWKERQRRRGSNLPLGHLTALAPMQEQSTGEIKQQTNISNNQNLLTPNAGF